MSGTSTPSTAAPTDVGLIAGRGRYPLLFCEAAKRRGVRRLVVMAMHGETDPEIAKLADHVEWLYVGQLGACLKALRRLEIRQVVFAGQIKPARLFGDIRPDLRAIAFLARLRERNAETIFGGVAGEFNKDGIEVLPATTFLEDHLAGAGQLGRVKVPRGGWDDIALGRRIAIEVSRLDIGQTVVVKKGTVLAVEGFEGTDKCILRGGELGKGEVTVVKVAKPKQDMRFDVPCVGPITVESLQAAKAEVLAVETGRTLLLDREIVLPAFDKAGIALVGIPLTGDLPG